MTSPPDSDQTFGAYCGRLSPAHDSPQLRQKLGSLRTLLFGPLATVLSRKGDLVVKVRVDGETLAVKHYTRRTLAQDLADRTRGSAGRRAWLCATALAERGIGTPDPVAFLELWQGSRLAENYFVTIFQADRPSFREELIHLYGRDPQCWKLMNLLQTVADAMRRLHEAGVQHGDLGNQNILLRRAGDGVWDGAQFIDLNRASVGDRPLSAADRAFDISRIFLPSDLLRVFKEMYFGGPPPADFEKAERRFRRRFEWHSRSRKWRHPIRSRQREKMADAVHSYPAPRDVWIWDERSAQPINVHRRRDRSKLIPWRQHLRVAGASLAAAGPAWFAYRRLLAGAFQQPVDLAGRIGLSISPHMRTWDRERAHLLALGARLPVLARFHRHDTGEARDFTAGALRELHQAGHPVAIVLVQDRQTARRPGDWAHFVNGVLERMAGAVEWVQVGQAINRVKWGVWSLEEYRNMVAEVRVVARGYQGLRFMGPAVIDFEYHHLAAALGVLPEGFRFDALAHLLYVDRRGAPENKQGRFSALEKFALARAIARTAGNCADRLIVSEVNWPLADGGVWSPIGSPYLYPGQQLASPPAATEQEYADYMIRYLLLALCSGLVERVYWWRLVARGFGLIDDREPAAWRPRPAYHALQRFLREAGAATFTARQGESVYAFARPDGSRFVVDTASGSPAYRAAAVS